MVKTNIKLWHNPDMSKTSVISNSKRERKVQSRFQRLWAKADAMARENVQLEKELDALVKRMELEVFPAERDLGQFIQKLAHRQLDFAQKKSLLKWQRAELEDWIHVTLAELSALGMVDDAIHDKLAIVRAAALGIDIDTQSDLSPADQLDNYFESADAEYREYIAGHADETEPDIDDDLLDGIDLEELLRRINDTDPEATPESESEYDPEEQLVTQTPKKNAVSDAVFKRIFRQTAAALHPDKETDQAKQQEKNELMSLLLKARKDYDLITMVRLHEKHAAVDAVWNADDEKELEQVLNEYINQQQQRQDQIIQRSSMHHMAYVNFYDKKASTVTRRINKHIKLIAQRRSDLQAFIAEVTTLKKLKLVLEERYDTNRFIEPW